MKSYKIYIWYNCKLSTGIVDTNNQLNNYLKNSKRIIHKFKRPESSNSPSLDQWRLEIFDNNCVIRMQFNHIIEIGEIQVVYNQGNRVFDFGENQIIYRFNVENNSASVKFGKGVYTLLPIFSSYK